MSRRRTRCLTYGNMQAEPVILMNGSRIHLESFVTLCGAPEDYTRQPTYAGHQDHKAPRPAGTCPRCWKVYRRTCEEASMAKVEEA